MSDWEKLEHALREQFGEYWYTRNASHQTLHQFATCEESRRPGIIADMKRETVQYAMSCVQAALSCGIVKL